MAQPCFFFRFSKGSDGPRKRETARGVVFAADS